MKTIAEIPLIGGHVALDFVNTAEQRGDPQARDYLRTPADLRLWGERVGLLAAGRADDHDVAEFERAVAARELLDAVLSACAQGERPTETQLDALAGLVAVAHDAATLEIRDGRVQWAWSTTELASIRHVAVAQAVELLGGESIDRVKTCPGEHCGWYFLDTTRSGNRRWCSMRECGQEAKDAQRRVRRQAGTRAQQTG